jgi:hypothetical protein
MTVQWLLLPLFIQVALTFVLLFWMGRLRVGAVTRGEVPPTSIDLRQPNWPPRVTQVANAFHNQLELPILFYVAILLVLAIHTADTVFILLAWIFVVSRLVHAFIHVTSNNIRHRLVTFAAGIIALVIMWIILAARILLA